MADEHRFASARLGAYLDESLPDGEDRRVRGHLRECAECRAELARLTDLSQALRAIRATAPGGLADRVVAYLDAEGTQARLSLVARAEDAVPGPPVAEGAPAWALARAQLRRTLLLSFVIGVAVTLLKDLGPLLRDGLTTQNCVVCGANFVAAFALLNVWLLLARPSSTYWR